MALTALAVWPLLGLLARGERQILLLGQLVPLMILVYSLARRGTGRIPLLTGVLGAGVFLLGDLFVPLLREPGELVFHWGVMTLAFLIGSGLRAAEERAVAAARRAVEAENSTRERAELAVAQERARIARELHDIVAHSVSVMVVQAGAAEQVVEEDPEFARKALGSIRSSGTSALTEMRRVVAMVREPAELALQPLPGVGALPALVESASGAGLDVELSVRGDRPALSAGLDLTAYRIVQEALTNVRRHSRADHARVSLDYGDGALRIEVRDDGPASAEATEPGHGLLGMRERVALFGGRLEARSDGPGFVVRAELPLEAT